MTRNSPQSRQDDRRGASTPKDDAKVIKEQRKQISALIDRCEELEETIEQLTADCAEADELRMKVRKAISQLERLAFSSNEYSNSLSIVEEATEGLI